MLSVPKTAADLQVEQQVPKKPSDEPVGSPLIQVETQIQKHNQNSGYKIDAFPGDGEEEVKDEEGEDTRKAFVGQVGIEEEKKEEDEGTDSSKAKKRGSNSLTDPIASFRNVQDQFQKIQQNFSNMRQGISKHKTQLSEWVF